MIAAGFPLIKMLLDVSNRDRLSLTEIVFGCKCLVSVLEGFHTDLSLPAGHRIIENPELEDHQGHRVQLLALPRTPQKSHHVHESIVEVLPEVRQADAATTSLVQPSFPDI